MAAVGIGVGIEIGRPGRGQVNLGGLKADLLSSTLPSWLSFSRAGNAMMFDSTGKLTYAPNNALLQSNNFTAANWTKSNGSITATGIDDPFGGNAASTFTASGTGQLQQLPTAVSGTKYLNSIWVRRRTGTGTITLSDPANTINNTIVINGGWQQFFIPGVSSTVGGLSLRVTVSGDAVDIYGATASAVTYETTPRSGDQVITGAAAYYGPRFDYDPTTLQLKGLLQESTPATNVVLRNRDLTNAAWTKSNATAVLNQAGIDGVANSASSVTATAANATALQSITLASSARMQSAYVKRLSGTGAVQMTTDGGTTWTTIAITSSWARYSIPVQTLANPQVGFQLATSGDSIAVDFVQNEASQAGTTIITSPILTAGGAVTRPGEILSVTVAALAAIQSGNWSHFVDLQTANSTPGASNRIVNGQGNIAITSMGSDTAVGTPSGSATLGSSGHFSAGARIAVGADSTGVSVVGNGGTVGGSATPISAITSANLGSTAQEIPRWYRSVAFYPKRLTNAQLQAASIVGAAYP